VGGAKRAVCSFDATPHHCLASPAVLLKQTRTPSSPITHTHTHTPPPPPPSSPVPLPQIQQTVARVTEVCWDKCVGYPGRSLSGRESGCMADCAKRFIETTQFIVQRFQAKAGAEGGGGGDGGGGLFE
jgi:import inner membrane translocase subunit TIM8